MEYLFGLPEKHRVAPDTEQASGSDVVNRHSYKTNNSQTILRSVLIVLLAATIFVHLQNLSRTNQFVDDHVGQAVLLSSSAFLVLFLTLFQYWPKRQPSEDRLSIVSKRAVCFFIWLFANMAITSICYCFIVYGNGGSPMDGQIRIPEVYKWGAAGEALYLSITGDVVLFVHYWNLILLKGSSAEDRLARLMKRVKYTIAFLFACFLLYGLAYVYVEHLAPREDPREDQVQ